METAVLRLPTRALLICKFCCSSSSDFAVRAEDFVGQLLAGPTDGAKKGGYIQMHLLYHNMFHLKYWMSI